MNFGVQKSFNLLLIQIVRIISFRMFENQLERDYYLNYGPHLVLNNPRALRLSPSERQVSTMAHNDVTLPESSCTDLSMTDSSIMCFTSFFKARKSFSFCSGVAIVDLDLCRSRPWPRRRTYVLKRLLRRPQVRSIVLASTEARPS